MGSSRSSSLRIYANPPAEAGSEQPRDAPIRLIVAGPPNAPEVPPPLLGKGKGQKENKPNQVSQGVGFPQNCRSSCREGGTK